MTQAMGSRHERTHQTVEAEIRREKAAALGRAGERLEVALQEVRTLGARLALLIQREAIGLRRHALVDQLFPEPPRRRPAVADR